MAPTVSSIPNTTILFLDESPATTIRNIIHFPMFHITGSSQLIAAPKKHFGCSAIGPHLWLFAASQSHVTMIYDVFCWKLAVRLVTAAKKTHTLGAVT